MSDYVNNSVHTTPQSETTESSYTPSNEPEPKQKSFLRELIEFLVVALVIIVPLRTYVAQPFVVSGASMDPTFHTGDYLIIDQLSYRFHEPMRGDVIVMRYPENPSEFFIKRIIGLPGETVSVKHSTIRIKNAEHPEGFVLDEPFLVNTGNGLNQSLILGPTDYFVMGDNRPYSSDSRTWGPLPRDHIIGRPFVRLLPVDVIDYKPGEYIFEI